MSIWDIFRTNNIYKAVPTTRGFFKLDQWFFSPPLVDVQTDFATLKLVKETLEAFTLKGSGTQLYYFQHNPSQAHFQVSTTINITNQTQTIIQHQVIYICLV